jgi:hypothetical protein
VSWLESETGELTWIHPLHTIWEQCLGAIVILAQSICLFCIAQRMEVVTSPAGIGDDCMSGYEAENGGEDDYRSR